MLIEDILIRDEGIKLRLYQDAAGKFTIGVGRNLEDVGLSEEEALLLLRNDIAAAQGAAGKYAWFSGLDDIRQTVVVCMVFNMGPGGLAQFTRLIAALERRDFESAASEMLASRWAAQVGKRAVRLAEMMRSGEMAP